MELAQNLKKFTAELGTLADFVAFVRGIETRVGKNIPGVMASPDIRDFPPAGQQHRYLILKKGAARIVDFRHFFAAAAVSYSGRLTAVPGGGRSRLVTPDSTLLLGLGNEIAQCIEESAASAFALKSKINSCFSHEDLGSNRLGAQFGKRLIRAESEAAHSVATELRQFLRSYDPADASEIRKVTAASSLDVSLEALLAVVTGITGPILDILIPPVY